MERTSKGRPKSSRIRTEMNMRNNMADLKNVHIVKRQDIQKEHAPTLLEHPVLAIDYVSFNTKYSMYT